MLQEAGSKLQAVPQVLFFLFQMEAWCGTDPSLLRSCLRSGEGHWPEVFLASKPHSLLCASFVYTEHHTDPPAGSIPMADWLHC